MLSFLFRDIKLLSMMISLSKHRNNRISIGFLFFIKMKTKSAARNHFYRCRGIKETEKRIRPA